MSASTIVLSVMSFLPRRVPFPLVLLSWIAFAASIVAFYWYRMSRRRAQLRINEKTTTSGLPARPFILYLRPFISAGRLLMQNVMPSPVDRQLLGPLWDAELAMTFALEELPDIVAIGHQPGGYGAAKLITGDGEWVDLMKGLAERAELIILVPLDRPATLFEAEHLATHPELLSKTVVFMPPTLFRWRTFLGLTMSVKRRWNRARQTLAQRGLHLPEYSKKGAWFLFDEENRMLQQFALGQLQEDYTHTLFEELIKITRSSPEPSERRHAYSKMDVAAPPLHKFYADGVFSIVPVLIVVLLLRSFVVEPYKIPSASMLPTLFVGDFVLVNKHTYGLRIPFTGVKFLDIGEPQRGDVMVFRYPQNWGLDYIKRVVGLPGDNVSYRQKRLSINGQQVETKLIGEYNYAEFGANFVSTLRFSEKLDTAGHAILVTRDGESRSIIASLYPFPYRDNCAYDNDGFTCKVPVGHYFVMGDNRDSSSDSRYWGFVPEDHILGRAFLVWWNFDELSRIGASIK